MASTVTPLLGCWRATGAKSKRSEQLRLQAAAELQGAHAWRSIAAGVSDPTVSAELARCSELEEISSAMVLQVLAKFNATPSTAGCLI